jgi:hypothetical protein
MWNVNCVVIPAVTGAAGKITKVLRKHLEAIPGNIQYIRYRRQLYLEHRTYCGKYCRLELRT